MIFFTSDLHLGHRAVLNLCSRPFENIDEMNRTLIDNFNARVKTSDTVYLLGDLTFRIPVEEANELISMLNGKKIFIRGNHDKNYDESLFEYTKDFDVASLHGQYVAMMHYPMLQWPRSRHGSMHLHGHVHGSRADNVTNREKGILRFDVGVDANNYYPVSIEEILDFFGL